MRRLWIAVVWSGLGASSMEAAVVKRWVRWSSRWDFVRLFLVVAGYGIGTHSLTRLCQDHRLRRTRDSFPTTRANLSGFLVAVSAIVIVHHEQRDVLRGFRCQPSSRNPSRRRPRNSKEEIVVLYSWS